MSSTREFRKNPITGLKMYSQFFLPMKNFLDGQIKKLNLEGISLGSGNRVLVKGGVLNKKYKITVPQEYE